MMADPRIAPSATRRDPLGRSIGMPQR